MMMFYMSSFCCAIQLHVLTYITGYAVHLLTSISSYPGLLKIQSFHYCYIYTTFSTFFFHENLLRNEQILQKLAIFKTYMAENSHTQSAQGSTLKLYNVI